MEAVLDFDEIEIKPEKLEMKGITENLEQGNDDAIEEK
jgi:hypothetical protein